MNIIKQGVLPQEKVHQVTCRTCSTVFEFSKAEAQLVFDQRDGNYLKVNCPLCGNSCTTSP